MPTEHSALAGEMVGARVRMVRIGQGISLRKLAGKIGISPATLSQIETGHTGLSVARLTQLADAMGVSVPRILDASANGHEHGIATRNRKGTGSGSAGRASEHPHSHWRVYEPLDFDPVLRAALDEFLDIGYHGATVRDIATRAGLSVSGIYHYYASKQDMLVRILEYGLADLLSRAEGALAEGRDPVERFSLLIEHLVLFHTHRAEIGFVGAAERRSLDPGADRKIAALRTSQQRLVDREVEDAVRIGRFRADMPHERTRGIVTMCTALPTWWRPDGPYSPEEIARQYVTFALDLLHNPEAKG